MDHDREAVPAAPTCPGCGQAITAVQWARAVAYTRDGARAHLVCLERGLPVPIHTNRDDRPWYLLARCTCSPERLRPGARFQELFGDSVIIAVPYRELWPQCQLLLAAGLARPSDPIYDGIDAARLAAAEAAGLIVPAPGDDGGTLIAGIWGDDSLPF